MRKLLGLSAVLALFIFLVVPFSNPQAAGPFKDVKLYEDEITYLTTKEVIKGYEGGYFRPDAPIKRLQAVQMILREKGITDFTAPNPNFMDIQPGDYGYQEIAKAVQLGIISGKTDAETGRKSFDAWGTLTRGQMAKILVLAYHIQGEYKGSFKDVERGNWVYEYVGALAANNITTGYGDHTFRPNTKISRQHFALFLARHLNPNFKPMPAMKAHFIDVGQGDSSLIVTPNRKTILIDGGKQSAGEKVVAYLKKNGIASIDLVVATHPDADHIGGLLDVLQSVHVKKVLDSGKTHTTQTYMEYLNLIEQKAIPFEIAKTGNNINVDNAINIQVLNSGDAAEDNNEASIVLKISYGTVDFLYTGDAGLEAEAHMISRYHVEAEVLKVGHHGSETSSSQVFISAVKPKVSVLSVGADNSYGHPDSVVVNRLKAIGSNIYSTSASGDIIVTTDGKTYSASAAPWTGGNTVTPAPVPTPQPAAKIDLVSVNVQTETAMIKNIGTVNVDMTGWKLVSVEGNQTYEFPSGYVLKAGAIVYVTSGRNAKNQPPAYLKWTGSYMWNDKGDPAKLINAEGKVVEQIR
ncbi:S-layer homology domain-containing protein [Priestia abyssalis]|uniref:S-layer homology domain-containing protein n=1 Tax=Priestia abyssalis TaxID=1221450 RepID=UPI001472B66E|nr:S-layer homology domain-containing protein [Priestia abyssalis]